MEKDKKITACCKNCKWVDHVTRTPFCNNGCSGILFTENNNVCEWWEEKTDTEETK